MLQPPAASPTWTDDWSLATPPRVSLLFDRLRHDTANEHRALESRLDLVSDGLDLRRYVELLQNFHSATSAYETVAEHVLPPPLLAMFESRRKTALLDADLHFFGAEPRDDPADQVQAAQVLTAAPLSSVGAMYVFEGSTLGGTVIARHLATHLGLHTLKGRHYFTPYPGRTALMWKTFKQRGDALVGEDSNAIDTIVTAAGATFTWLTRALPRGA